MDEEAKRAELARLKGRRDAAGWYVAVGLLLLFAGRLVAQLLVGGVVSILAGIALYMFWSWRMAKVKGDPWAYDPELDGPRGPGR